MPEHLPRGTDEHEPYDELCALAAGGLVEGSELVDFRTHLKKCNKCRAEYEELSDLVTRELPQAQGKFRQRLTVMRAKPLAYSRQRFLRRARAEGVVFSPEVDSSAPIETVVPPSPSPLWRRLRLWWWLWVVLRFTISAGRQRQREQRPCRGAANR